MKFEDLCPVCHTHTGADIDMSSAYDGDVLHQTEECEHCHEQIVFRVQVTHKLRLGLAVFEEEGR